MRADEALRLAARQLAEAGIASAVWDAELLLRHVLGWDRAWIVAESQAALAEVDAQLFLELVAERARRRPLQHITGTQAFWRHEFRVTPDVLIPRPETELLVEASLALLRDVHAPTLVDVGTGSGCIALSLAAERPDAVIHALDISPPALGVAEDNARRLGLAGRVRFQLGDLLAPVAELAGQLDLVVSNPPYVDPAEALAPEVRDHEPALALFPPGDPYAVYRRLAPEARALLRPGGHLVVEVGQGMAEAVATLAGAASLTLVQVLPDLGGIPRAVVARRN